MPVSDSPDLRCGTRAEMADARTRSTLADGRVVGWYGAPGVVIDAELAEQPVPAALAAAYGSERFWERWTAAECAAKHFDVPLPVWLREHGLSEGVDGLHITYRLLDGALVALAGAESEGGTG